MIPLKEVNIVTNFSLSSFFWQQLQDVLAMNGRARTISNGDVKIDLRRIWKGLTGSATFQNKGTVVGKTFITHFFCLFCHVSFCLVLLILTWISKSELGHINSTPFCRTIDFDMHEFKLFLFPVIIIEMSSCVWTYNDLIINLAWQWRYLADKNGFPFYWDTLYIWKKVALKKFHWNGNFVYLDIKPEVKRFTYISEKRFVRELCKH